MKKCKWCGKTLKKEEELLGCECMKCRIGMISEDSYLFSPKKSGNVYIVGLITILTGFIIGILIGLNK